MSEYLSKSVMQVIYKIFFLDDPMSKMAESGMTVKVFTKISP